MRNRDLFYLLSVFLLTACGAVPVDGSISESEVNALGTGRVTGFELLDATAGRSLGPLGSTLVLSDFQTTQFSIRAIVSTGSTGSLAFTLDGPDVDNYEHIEKWAPYTLAGDGTDANGNKTYVGRSLSVGTYTLTAAFADGSKTVRFDVVARASAFRLVNTETGTRTQIASDQKFDVAQWPSAFSIEAAVTSSTGVTISLLGDSDADGTYETTLRTKLESSAPWVLCGNSGSQVFACPIALGVGAYKVTAGFDGKRSEVRFSLLNMATPTATPSATPTATPTATPPPGANGLLPDDTRGYVSRACGFDMDDDGIPGEPEDCNVCDGDTRDPDGDGDFEDQIYVDCNSGNDAGLGTKASPYRTIAKALAMADGPGDGNEDIVCARATCSAANGSRVSAQDVPVSGVANKGPTGAWFYTRPRRGPEERAFQYPADPVMIVGWDTDNDGDYPPHDTDQSEPLVIDACSAEDCSSGTTTSVGFHTRSDTDYIELAHFTMKNYGRRAATPAASISLVGAGIKTGVYLHDLHFDKASYREKNWTSRAVIYTMLGGSRGLSWGAVENIKMTDWGSWPMRGSVNADYLRVRNWTLFGPKPPQYDNGLGIKLWKQNNVEYLNIDYDADIERIGVSYGVVHGMHVSKSSSNVVLRNNSFRNCNSCMVMDYRDCDEEGQTGCATMNGQTTTRNILLDRQLFTQDLPVSGARTFLVVHAIASDGRDRGGATRVTDPDCLDTRVGFENFTVRNSVFRRTASTGTAMKFKIGSNCPNTPLGPVVVDNNTFISNPTLANPPAVLIGQVEGSFDYDYVHYAESYRFRNNVFTGLDGDVAFEIRNRGSDGEYGENKTPTDFEASHNSYGGAAKFVLDLDTSASLASWQADTGYDGTSDDCSTLFSGGGYHLASGDTCSKNKGDNGTCSASDVDGEARARRASDVCDRGADEFFPMPMP